MMNKDSGIVITWILYALVYFGAAPPLFPRVGFVSPVPRSARVN